MSEHDRFEELASLAAIGELTSEEHKEFMRHAESCSQCRTIVAETRSIASTSFLAAAQKQAGAQKQGNTEGDIERRRRLRENIERYLPDVVAVSYTKRYKRLAATGIAAAFVFVLGTAVGGTLGARQRQTTPSTTSRAVTAGVAPVVQPRTEELQAQGEALRLKNSVSNLQKQIGDSRNENLELKNKLAASDQQLAEVQKTLDLREKESIARSDELAQARNDLNAARGTLAQVQAIVLAHETTIEALRYRLADKEARLAEVSATVDREREMLSKDREVRDVMGARDLHIVDVVDRDGKGRARKAFGRAFYTQGKSLIFYAFDLPTKNTADGKFVYAAWGSNSNNLNGKTAHSLGIFYNDDQTQHRWAMKFDDPKLLEEIDTVFVTLEPAGKPFAAPTGKPLLEAYFGTPPNHP